MLKEIIFQNGDKITIDKAGNTYTGTNAQKVMFFLWKYAKNQAEELELLEKIVIPKTSGLVLINFK